MVKYSKHKARSQKTRKFRIAAAAKFLGYNAPFSDYKFYDYSYGSYF